MKLITELTYKALGLANVYREGDVGVLNTEEAKDAIQSLAQPVIDILLWAIPTVGLIVIVAMGLKHFSKPEHERMQQPLVPMIVKIIGLVVLLEMIPTIFKLFNIGAGA